VFKPLNFMAFLLRGARLDKLKRKSRASRRPSDARRSTFAYRGSAKTAARPERVQQVNAEFSFDFNVFRRGAAIAS
jgi:hypothetical protein